MILAIVLSALVLFGWSLLSDGCFPTAGPPTVTGRERQGQAGAAAAGIADAERPQALREPRDGPGLDARACGSRRRACRDRST